MTWTVGQKVGIEVRTPAERMHLKAGTLKSFTVTRTDPVGRCYVDGAGYFDHAGKPLDRLGQGIQGDSLFAWDDMAEARLRVQETACAR